MKDDSKPDGQSTVGYLGQNGLLYCSNGCAVQAGERNASAVDEEDLDALLEGGGLSPGALCPSCGDSFPVSWPERTPD